jgi:hypothetical protein
LKNSHQGWLHSVFWSPILLCVFHLFRTMNIGRLYLKVLGRMMPICNHSWIWSSTFVQCASALANIFWYLGVLSFSRILCSKWLALTMSSLCLLTTSRCFAYNVNDIGLVFGYSDKFDSQSNTNLESLKYKMTYLFTTVYKWDN